MNNLEKIESSNVVPMVQAQASNPMALLAAAIDKGASVETLEKLMALQERYEANESRKEFDAALSEAKAEIQPIVKQKTVDFQSAKGRTNYQYESLDDIAKTIDPILAKHGLSYRYRAAQDGTKLTVTCILSHRRGHREETTLQAFNDDTGNKNAIQAVGSASVYLQRYTLKLALGLAATKDTDAIPPEEPSAAIDAEQFQYITSLIEKASADVSKMLAYIKADSLETMTQAQYRTVEALLRKKIKAMEAMNGNA